MPEWLKSYSSCIPQRYVVVALTSGALLVSYLDKQTYFRAISESVVRPVMLEQKNLSSCPKMVPPELHSPLRRVWTEFYWDHELVRAITQAFFIGYLVILVPAGMMADWVGAKLVIGIGMLITSFLSLLSPIIVTCGPAALLMMGFLHGISQGLVFPSLSTIVAQWAPLTARTTTISLIQSGLSVGWFLGFLLPVLFSVFHSWQNQFYFTSSVGLLWFFLWNMFAFSQPAESPYISQAELTMLYDKCEGIGVLFRSSYPYVPCKSVLTSPPVVSLLLISFASSWINTLMFNHFHTYLINALRFTEKLSITLTMLAELAFLPSMIIAGVTSDWLIKHNYMTKTTNRKVFAVLSNMLVVPCLVGMVLCNCDGIFVLSLYTMLWYCQGFISTIVSVNPVDLSPQHAGFLQAILNSAGTISALFSSEVVATLCNVWLRCGDLAKWHTVFLISATALTLLSLPYLWFGSGEVQPWNYSNPLNSKPFRGVILGPNLQ